MILHASITADRPRPTAEMLAQLIGGEAFPMPQLAEGAWLAIAGDGRGRAIEVLARGCEFRRDAPISTIARGGRPGGPSGFHLLVETALGEAAVCQAAHAAGATARRAPRGPFEVIEVWIDDVVMLEVVTPELAAAYHAIAGLEAARAALGGVA
jgi:hypothetical protein